MNDQVEFVGDQGGQADRRDQFLIEMYREMWGNINRHILVVWQSVGLMAGTFALFALVSSNAVSLDFASTLIAGASLWLLAHIVDANYWYSRNLAIIINIEREFLSAADLSLIHPYFKKHRPPSSPLEHLVIQAWLGFGVWVAVILYHFWNRVLPGFAAPWSSFEPARAGPYAISIVGVLLLWRFFKKQQRRYREFLADAPGRAMEVGG